LDEFQKEMPVNHLVFLKLRPSSDAAAVMAALRALVGVIPGLRSFGGGANTSTEGIARGYNHAFAMVFDDAAARDGYLPHPEHVRVKDFIGAHLQEGPEPVCVVDYEFA